MRWEAVDLLRFLGFKREICMMGLRVDTLGGCVVMGWMAKAA